MRSPRRRKACLATLQRRVHLPLGGLTGAGIPRNVGEQAGMEHALPMARGGKAAIEVEIRASEIHPALFGRRRRAYRDLLHARGGALG